MGLFVGVCVLAIILTCTGLWIFHARRLEERARNNISFMESIKLTGMPIISFTSNGKTLNFLLDTGSTYSIINSSELDSSLIARKLDAESTVYGLDGVAKDGGMVEILLSYKDRVFSVQFMSIDMLDTFAKMKSHFGVTLHGILGVDFFDKYKYVLDFNSMVAYTMKK